MTWPRKADGPLWKTGRTALRRARQKKARAVKSKEQDQKKAVRKRDRRCRFPLCGCAKLGLKLEARPEVSHDRHKGMGGNPAGDRSESRWMMLLCKHRHQDGAFSLHKGTIRKRYLTDEANDGPVAWELWFGRAAVSSVDVSVDWWRRLAPIYEDDWREVAREVRPGVLEPLEPWQRTALEQLAEMTL